MMPNKTYELRKLYFEQSSHSAPKKAADDEKPLLIKWPQSSYFNALSRDAQLLQKALKPEADYRARSVSQKIFSSEVKKQRTSLDHISNIFYERCRLHKTHLSEINSRHMDAQEKLFGVKINNFPDKAKRLSNLEGQLAQLEKERRDEEIAFWKDTAELREHLFENAGEYSAARQREKTFADVEADYDGN